MPRPKKKMSDIMRAELTSDETEKMLEISEKTRLRKMTLAHNMMKRYIELCQLDDVFISLLVDDDAVIDSVEANVSGISYRITLAGDDVS